jgi:predicted cation transporter
MTFSTFECNVDFLLSLLAQIHGLFMFLPVLTLRLPLSSKRAMEHRTFFVLPMTLVSCTFLSMLEERLLMEHLSTLMTTTPNTNFTTLQAILRVVAFILVAVETRHRIAEY